MHMTDVLNTKGVLRLIQSIPSPKAEPFKVWLAQVGSERLDEIADPEKAIQRGAAYYREKGYSDEWINQRLRTIEIRKKLTDEWSARGVETDLEYAMLTNELTKAWSGLSVTWDPAAADGARVTELRIGGRAIDVEKTYILATNNFVAASEDYPALAAAAELHQYGACDELLKRYLSWETGEDWTDSLTRTVFTAGEEETVSEAPSSAEPASSAAVSEAVSSAAASSQAAETESGGAGPWIAIAVVILAAVGGSAAYTRRRGAGEDKE